MAFFTSRCQRKEMADMFLQNLHTHTTYCDGADTPEEIVLAAIDKGFDSIGFSEHSYMSYSPVYVKLGDRIEEYKKDVSGLKNKYKDIIKVYLGLEVDMYSKPDMSGYDYLIGSVHYLKFDEEYVCFDRPADDVANVINNYFGGDGMKFAKAYYKALIELPEYGNFDIIGHFDVVTKHNEERAFFDASSKEYLSAAIEAAEALSGKIPLFEVNTGAIGRGYRTAPYPSVEILKELKRLGFGAIISSDSHKKAMLDCAFDDARELLKTCGFKERYILTDSGFKEVAI